MSIFSDQLKAEIEKLALLPDKDYHDHSAQAASKLGIEPDMIDVLYEDARKKHLKAMGARSAGAFFSGFPSINEVRARLTELKAKVTEDLRYVYEDPFLQAAAALEHFDPGEFARLANKLKSQGLKSWERWQSTVRKTARLEAERIKQHHLTRKLKAAGGSFSGQQGQDTDEPLIVLPEVKPAAAPVIDAPALFNEVKKLVRRFVFLSERQLTTVVLWITFTHAFDVADVSPRLALLSPKKRCGKTTLQRVLALLSSRSLVASNISPAAIFRTVDQLHPTLLLDEVDTFAGRGTKQSERTEETRGILNSGHTKDTAYVIRAEKVGDRWMPRQFSTWAPICYAAIGRLSDTWEDRSIKIMMKRRLRTETVEKLTRRNAKTVRTQAEVLVAQLARWAKDNLDVLSQAEPKFPPGLNDRAEDNWDVLLAIADLVGPDWGKAAREAAKALSADRADDVAEEGLDVKLLLDINTILKGLDITVTTVGSSELCGALVALKEAPWVSLPRTGKPLTTTRLALMLRPFEVYAKHTQTGNEYVCVDFKDAIDRYLTTTSTQQGEPPTDPSDTARQDTKPSGAFQSFRVSETHGVVGQTDDFNPSAKDPAEGLGDAQFNQRRVNEMKGLNGSNAANGKVAERAGVSEGPSDNQRKAHEDTELNRQTVQVTEDDVKHTDVSDDGEEEL